MKLQGSYNEINKKHPPLFPEYTIETVIDDPYIVTNDEDYFNSIGEFYSRNMPGNPKVEVHFEPHN